MKTDNLGFIVFGVIFVAIIVVAIRQNLFRDIDDMMKSVEIGKHNIAYEAFPDRGRPLVLSGQEISLKQVYPDFFKKFNKEDWREFWDIIYGSHPLVEFDNEMLAEGGRNYFMQEVQRVLAIRYPEFFSSFSTGAWDIFWKQIFNISPGVMALFETEKQKESSDRRLSRRRQRDTHKISTTVERLGTIDTLKK